MISLYHIRTAISSLGNARAYAITVIITLSVTLGALVAVFNLNYQMLAKPLPYPEQDQLYLLQGDLYGDGKLDLANMYPYPAAIKVYTDPSDRFEKKALVNYAVDLIRNLPDTPRVNITYSTPELFDILGTAMILGRGFSATEGLDSQVPVAVLSYSAWQRYFGKDPNIVGTNLQVGNVEFRIVGITTDHFVEPQFMGPGRDTEVWLSWDYNPVNSDWRRAWAGFIPNEYVVVKLNSAFSATQVGQELTATLDAEFASKVAGTPSFEATNVKFRLTSFKSIILGDSKKRVQLLLIGALVLLLIAAANVTNLMLARAASQQKNLAIQAALGAQKLDLFRNVFVEVSVLLTIAFIISLGIAFAGLQLFHSVASEDLPRLAEINLSWEGIFFAFSCSALLAAILTALIVRQINYRVLNNILRSSGKGAGIQVSSRVRSVLILVQVALTGLMLVACVQILQNSWQNINQPLGFQTRDIVQLQLNLGSRDSASAEELTADLIAIRNQLQGHPKINSVSLVADSPLTHETDPSYLSANQDLTKVQQGLLNLNDPNFFNMLGFELTAGRYFTDDEFRNQENLVILNQTMARELQIADDPLQKRFYWLNSPIAGQPYTVIGVVKDLTLPGGKEKSRMFFPRPPIGQGPINKPQFLIKLQPGQSLTKIELNSLLGQVNGQYKVAQLVPLPTYHKLLLARDKLAAVTTAALAILAVGLAAIGIYGVLSYSIQSRRFELGIRMAIGATPTMIYSRIFKDNFVPVLAGLALALVSFAVLRIWAQHEHYNLPFNLLALFVPVILIITLTALTSLLSVWKILSRPAINALRNS